MHGHTGGHVSGGHIPPPHHQPHQPVSHHSSDSWSVAPAAPAAWETRPRQNQLTAFFRNPRAVSALIILTITVVLLMLFTF